MKIKYGARQFTVESTESNESNESKKSYSYCLSFQDEDINDDVHCTYNNA